MKILLILTVFSVKSLDTVVVEFDNLEACKNALRSYSAEYKRPQGVLRAVCVPKS